MLQLCIYSWKWWSAHAYSHHGYVSSANCPSTNNVHSFGLYDVEFDHPLLFFLGDVVIWDNELIDYSLSYWCHAFTKWYVSKSIMWKVILCLSYDMEQIIEAINVSDTMIFVSVRSIWIVLLIKLTVFTLLPHIETFYLVHLLVTSTC